MGKMKTLLTIAAFAVAMTATGPVLFAKGGQPETETQKPEKGQKPEKPGLLLAKGGRPEDRPQKPENEKPERPEHQRPEHRG